MFPVVGDELEDDNMLCLHKGSIGVTREALQSVPTPPAIGRHLPIPHYELACTAVDRAKQFGLEITKEEWGLGSGGARLYGVLDFKPFPGLTLPPGMAPSMGLRSSHDKSLAINICVGNGVFLGDFSVRKLHTTGFRLVQETDAAFRQFENRIGGIGIMVDGLQRRALTDTEAKALTVDAFRAGTMPWRYMPEVLDDYFEPKHQEFNPRNAWSLYNAFTDVVKQRNPNDQIRTFRSLNKTLVAACN